MKSDGKYVERANVLGVGVSSLNMNKAVGMLLARKIAESECQQLAEKLESHDSVYIGSDVFYSFLVRNRKDGQLHSSLQH